MAKSARRPDHHGRSGRRVWSVVGLVALGVVVFALVLFALGENRGVENAGSTPGASTSATAPSTPPVETPAFEPAEAAPKVAVPARVLGALDGALAVRAASTTCPDPTTIEVTEDGGANWEAFEAPGVSAVQRIVPGGDAFIGLIGLAAEGCAPQYERTFTGGEAWEPAPDELVASWYVDPADRAVVHSPAGDVAAPCGVVVQLAAIDETSAAVLCDDATVHATADAGASWGAAVPVSGAVAITAGGAGYRVAVANVDGCAGAQLVELAADGGSLAAGAGGACLESSVSAGGVAVASGDDGSVWMWVGDVLARSDDGGGSWL
ncbi:hypothetical protein [Agromyces italicus]|uniref:hypothetical protein n=1 Tax=Agromyces italicus TaxID=279572 RepID=UPI0004229F0D|nr:hypothetical protein [Agromyces italicus]